MSAPLAGSEPLIDIHAHFYQEGSGRADWKQLNDNRLHFGDRIGITWHVASVLGSWGRTSPTYFQSPSDTRAGNAFLWHFAKAESRRVRGYVAVNPNDTDVAIASINEGAAEGAVGLKLAAARRADDEQLNAVIQRAADLGFPVLHHIWQHRRRHWPGQDISDGADLSRLAERFPKVAFILAHIGGGGDYAHTFAAVRDVPNVYLDLSGSGVDRGMLDDALDAVGPGRMLWGADITLCTGLAKLRALEVIGLNAADHSAIRWANAVRIFPAGAFPGLSATGAQS